MNHLLWLQVSKLVVSHDGRYLFTTGGSDASVHMWEVNVKSVFTWISFCRCTTAKNKQQIEGFWPEWCIWTIYHCRDTPFWLETLEINTNQPPHPVPKIQTKRKILTNQPNQTKQNNNIKILDILESSFGISLKGIYISSVSLEWRSHEPKGCTSLL